MAPLSDSDTAALIDELLGSDPSVGELAPIVAERAAGNPFFAEEMVRELAERGVLEGSRGGYICRADIAEVECAGHRCRRPSRRASTGSTPRPSGRLNAAAVIGSRFDADLLAALGIDPVVRRVAGRAS